jgi:hypothetical protein
MLRYILAFFGLKVIMALALAAMSFFIEDIPNSVSTAATIIAAVGAILWFIKREDRRLQTAEIMTFAVGAAISDLIFSVAWFVGITIAYDLPVSWAGAAEAVGGGVDASDMKTVIIFSLLIGLAQVFALSAFFAWLLTKNLTDSNDGEVG